MKTGSSEALLELRSLINDTVGVKRHMDYLSATGSLTLLSSTSSEVLLSSGASQRLMGRSMLMGSASSQAEPEMEKTKS
jgi:hypothetical protein